MAIVLLLAFRSRMRLLPLALALASAALVFGLLDLVGGSLTMASVAVLPILIGLAVDYAIQFQARLDEVQATGASGADGSKDCRQPLRPDDRDRLPRHGRRLPRAPPLADPDGARLRRPPRGRGPARLRPGDDRRLRRPLSTAPLGRVAPRGEPSRGSFSYRRDGGPRRRQDPPVASACLVQSSSRPSCDRPVGRRRRPRGDRLGSRHPDRNRLAKSANWPPTTSREVKDLNTFEPATGTTGDLEVLIEAPDLTSPATIEWMAGFKAPRPQAERRHRRPGAVGLPHPRRRQGHQVRHRSDPRGALVLLASARSPRSTRRPARSATSR